MKITLPIYNHSGFSYTFNRRNRGWTFNKGNFTYVAHFRGADKARLIAAQLDGALKRAGKVDGLCREAINKITGFKKYCP